MRGFGAAAIAARLGGGMLGSAALGGGGHYVGGRVFGEGSLGQTVLAVGGGLVGGGLGYGAGARYVPSATTIAQRRATAVAFYRAQGFPEGKIAGHLDGIDFARPVGVVTLRSGRQVAQWQAPGAPQGTYYAKPGVAPTRLGINPRSELRGTSTVVDRTATRYELTRDVQVLRSRARPILDTWSVPREPFQTRGGAVQYFTTSSSAFRPLGGP